MQVEKVDKHKEKLKDTINNHITGLFEKVLDYAEVAVPNQQQFSRLRAKVLRAGNDCIRNLKKEVDARYEVKYDPPADTIIETRIANKVKERK